jgi:hypothetical protein
MMDNTTEHTGTVQNSETTKTAVKRVIANLEGCPASKLGTLSHCVNITNLNDIVSSNPTPDQKAQSVLFSYCGYEVVVYRDRTIEVTA